MPGTKDTVSIKIKSGKRMKVQKKLLRFNLKEIYALFKEKYANIKIGFTRFSMCRPKNCILAQSHGTHSVCVCPIHQNYNLLLFGKDLHLKMKFHSFIVRKLLKYIKQFFITIKK